MKVIEMFGATRAHLGNPSHTVLGDHILFNALYTALDFYRIMLGLVNQNWVASDIFLSVDSQANEYLIAEPIGKVLKVEFYDDNYPWRNGPEVRICHLQDTDLVQGAGDNWWWSAASLPEDGYLEGSYIASAICFYGTPTKARIVPRPLQQVQYRIWHDQMTVSLPTLSQKPGFMETFHRMIPLNMASSCLDKCGFEGDNLRGKTDSIGTQLAKWEALFDKYIKYSNHPQTGMRRAFIPGGHRRR